MPLSSSLISRSLEPLLNALWLFFLVWTAVTAAFWIAGDQWIATIPNSSLRAALSVVSSMCDTVWLVLGAANLYLHLAETMSLAKARLIGLCIGGVAVSIAASSVWTGYPLGSVLYTARLGLKLGPVPLGWPLLWFIIVVGGRELAARALPRASQARLAVITGVIAVLTDLNLEPVATQFRLFWFWSVPGTHLPMSPSWRPYATWFLGAGLLSWMIREQYVAPLRRPSWRPGLVPLIVNGMLLVGHARSALLG